MSFESFVKASAASWITSKARLNLQRAGTEIARRVRRQGHELTYFHRVDDPYSQLMVQVLPELKERFDVTIRPRVVERLPAAMYPDPARFEAYSILDSARLARLYGLGFPHTALVPDRLAIGMASRFLAANEDHPDFFGLAEELGAAVWRQDVTAIRKLCAGADMGEQRLEENQKLLRWLGHYASGTIYYGGEFYPGLDRLDHLERRLNALGLGDGETHFELTRLWQYALSNLDRSITGRTVEFFFSVRSPYSYLAMEQAAKLVEAAGVALRLRPVLPMVMRGLPVPAAKRRYIVFDAAREARLLGIPFGAIVDPVGAAAERALGIGMSLPDDGSDMAFFRSFMTAVWSEGVDGNSEKGMAYILEAAGLPARLARIEVDADWRIKAERNRQDMLHAGSWGVPTFRVGGTTLWGQDRLWAVVEALRHD
ncbi:DsbA family protein [Pseudokordiimonas caeni]|uniref:DsbA family protein n=1 Tax=Pseudokordiimonas caeni TaxID=2997908 RepID=UPI002811FBFE|nr:DsbA family protein [Pseudokordiimonas caeni]